MEYGQTTLILRRLLARIRDVMASEGTAHARLASIVSIIARDLSSEVCSIYVRRAGDVLELFATEGLRKTAVRRTRLRIGEGLIGEIAAKGRPIALADAQNHPHFVYRPETGEEIYQSLMGVPILRGGRVVGVVAIQSVRRQQYADEEIEALQTVAMVLAELVASGHLIARDELVPVEGIALAPTRLEGACIAGGIGVGQAVFHSAGYRVHKLVAEDVGVEHERLGRAVADMHGALDDMLRDRSIVDTGAPRDVLETYRMIAEDVGWLRRISEAIDSGLTAEAAVQKVNDEIHARMAEVADPYLRERVHDLEDLANRLLQHLLGIDTSSPNVPANQDYVIVARNLGPAQMLDYPRDRLRAIVLEEGSPNAHVSIVARALGIPVVGQVQQALQRIDIGDLLIVDAEHGQILVRPNDDIRQQYARSVASQKERRATYAAAKDTPAVTIDGTRIEVHVNAGLLVDIQDFDSIGADGIGLYRTEVPFMVRSEFPDTIAQSQLYRKVLDYAGTKPVVFRTLDIGGDKVITYGQQRFGESSAMGWRAMRVSQDRPAMLQQQIRALARAASGRELKLMFPMIADVSEFRFGRRLVEKELRRMERTALAPPMTVRVGAMFEVPSLAFQLDELLAIADFISIGTNDLFQFTFASDRSSYRMARRYEMLSPAALRFLRDILVASARSDRPLSLCGEMASRPLDAMTLIGLGYRSLSVTPPAVGPVKAMVRSVNLAELSEYVHSLVDSRQRPLRSHLRSFALDHGYVIQ
jgi:phosphotransferase system enzyme I (PtsP)